MAYKTRSSVRITRRSFDRFARSNRILSDELVLSSMILDLERGIQNEEMKSKMYRSIFAMRLVEVRSRSTANNYKL